MMETGAIVEMVKRSDLAKAGQEIEYCWFPLSGVASVIAADCDGNQVEIGLIGHEGMINSSVLFGGHQSEWRVQALIGGTALRLRALQVREIAHVVPGVREVLTAFDRALAVQAAASALVNARYTIAARLARWLLMCADRVGKERIDVTHEEIANLLGVRRAGVTVKLKELIACSSVTADRGKVTIIDRNRLLAIAGNSYGLAEEAYERLVEF